MNVTRHFSDTRTAQGRVRFLLQSGRVCLMAEGPGWSYSSRHATLEQAATVLATVSQVPDALYRQAMDELERQVQFDQAYRGAA